MVDPLAQSPSHSPRRSPARADSPHPEDRQALLDQLAALRAAKEESDRANAKLQADLQAAQDATPEMEEDMPASDQADCQRLKGDKRQRQLDAAKQHTPANLQAITYGVKERMHLHPRPKAFSIGHKGGPVEWIADMGQWLSACSVSSKEWGSTASSNLADGSTRRQFWQTSAVPQDQAGSLSWAQFNCLQADHAASIWPAGLGNHRQRRPLCGQAGQPQCQ